MRMKVEFAKWKQAKGNRTPYEFPIKDQLKDVLGRAVCVYGMAADGSLMTVLAAVTNLLSLVTSSTPQQTKVPLEQLLPDWLRTALKQSELMEVLPLLLVNASIAVYHPGWEDVLQGRREVRTMCVVFQFQFHQHSML
jgi:hypothetical protein